MVVNKIKYQIPSKVRDARNVAKYFFQTLIQEPIVRVFLNFNQIWHIQYFTNPSEAHADVFADLHRFDIHHWLNHSIHIFTILRLVRTLRMFMDIIVIF